MKNELFMNYILPVQYELMMFYFFLNYGHLKLLCLHFTDSDSGDHGTITYSIESGVTGSEFIINPQTGQLYVGSSLDFDIAPITYSIIIKATDGAGASDAATSTVSLSIVLTDRNDNQPQFTTNMFVFSVNENVAIGTSVGTVLATDAGDFSSMKGKRLAFFYKF